MKIGLMVAMDKEERLVRGILGGSGRMGGNDIIVARSGIGKVNAALAARNLIESEKPDAIVSTGVAGGVDPAIAGVLDAVVGVRTAYHDVDCGPEAEPGRIQGLPQFFGAGPGLVAATRQLDVPGVRLVHGLIATGDQFVSTPEAIGRIRVLYPDVAAVDMESAAIAHACFQTGTPFMSMRVVSDIPGTENHFSQYADFWDRVGASSFAALRALLEAL